MNRRVLVAGIGNIFLGDDGFGVEVARRLAGEELPAGVRVVDFGIRGVHLAYELMDGYHTAILVDAVSRGDEPGTLYVIEPDLGDVDQRQSLGDPVMDAHYMTPESVLALVGMLGGRLGRVLVVGCEPASTDERIGLSEPVARAVDEAVRVVRQLVADAAACAAAGHNVGEHGDHECGRKI
jgi:hydrogenase maturation protease